MSKIDRNPRIEKQPLWVQEYVAQLRQERDEALAENAQFKQGHFGEPGSNTYISSYDEPNVMLPEGATISFRLQDSHDPSEVIRVRITRKGRLNINGSRQFAVMPGASNDIEVSYLD
ncbi:hypothetical protein SEA_LUCY_55 [Arthrobacter phage Lucy]|uniref:Uncharacterized protein n=2 Tax=Korravirus drrobert TaxID=1982078 RepID=A0A222ZHM2_9CAUD|nr:hypothetical protein SEA_LUCY_55 [Arthrobacter phage Lucy]ASR83849.1 hypothetical protein SEA_PITADOG_56 [Arthrobacter phage PitaDog]